MSDQQDQSPSDTGLPENVASLLTYLFGFITGFIFLFIEKKNATVRYHAMQSIIVSLAMIVVSIVLGIVGGILGIIPVVGWIIAVLISLVVSLGTLGVWIALMVFAATNTKVAIPYVSPMAEKYSKTFLV